MEIEQIYLQYKPKVMGYIRSHVHSYADAEDLCSDVFEKIHLKLDGFDPQKAQLGTWIFSITRNRVIDFYRRYKGEYEPDENMPDDSPIDESLLKAESLSQLAKAMGKLNEQQKTIIVLRYYKNKPLTEIAEILSLSYGAVKLRHAAAVELLRREMGAAD